MDQQQPTPIYNRVIYWVQNYGSGGIDDRRAAEEFVVVETHELVRGLQNELIGIAKGNYKPESMDQLVGQKRKIKYGSYEEWAKLMLMWLSEHKQ